MDEKERKVNKPTPRPNGDNENQEDTQETVTSNT